MKLKLVICILLLGQILPAQIFSEFPLQLPFEGVKNSSAALVDVDGDGNQDALITGFGNSGSHVFRLYLGDGQGNFSEKIDTPFEGFNQSVMAIADIDGDDDPDVVITGMASSGARISKLYTNDGQGNFTEAQNNPFDPLTDGSITFADVDGDTDLDLLITGASPTAYLSKLFFNDGSGNFTESLDAPFADVGEGSAAFADIDNDGDQDVLITGIAPSASFDPISKLYQNDGLGNFTEISGTSFVPVINGATAFADIDGDNDPDVLITGESTSGEAVSELYINNGNGNFNLSTNNPIEENIDGSIAFADVDGDNDLDVIIVGITGQNLTTIITKQYLNDGQGNFTELLNTPFDVINDGTIDFADVDGDNDLDVLLTGNNNYSSSSISKLYFNDGQGNFSSSAPFKGASECSIAFADIDGDNDQDLLITGKELTPNSLGQLSFSELYRNDGQGIFTKVPDVPFEAAGDGSVAFADVDGDNDLDLLISGRNNMNPFGHEIAKLYLNNGQGDFTEESNTPFDQVISTSLAFLDVDGDDDQDVFIMGENSSGDSVQKLYLNDGLGNFTEMTDTPFQEINTDTFAYGDVDGDGDQDIFIVGRIDNTRLANLFINNGAGNFAEMVDTPFEYLSNSSMAFADIDGDNDQDIFLTGSDPSNIRVNRLYLNDGAGNFTEMVNTFFEPIYYGDVAFGDLDGDNDEDLLISGLNNDIRPTTNLYINDGQGNFNEFVDTPFENLGRGEIAFSDVNGDNSLDVFMSGRQRSGNLVSKLYVNQLSLDGASISGFIYYDVNENQIKDADEPGLSNDHLIQITPAPSFSYPTEEGKYRFYVDSGAYQLTAIPAENWEMTTPDTIDVNYENEQITDLNFGFIPTASIQLVESDISSGPTRCSFDVPFWLNYQNNGTTFENGYLEFSLTNDAFLQTVQPVPDTIIGNKLCWSFSDLAPSHSNSIRLVLTMPDASNLGDTLDFVATTFVIDDNQDTTQNTVYNYNPILNCAYDPNDKAAIPAGVGDENLTLFDSEFEYRIRFQNTGTDTAFTVRIEDDLDPNLDWNTFRPISASHPYEVDMDVESGRVTFLFRNILLPDSTTNEVLSHGFVKYKISPLSGLSEETQITNEAGIFFDFNEPIWTNTTLNTMVSMLTNTEETSLSSELTVIPNPFQKTTIFRMKDIPGNRGTLNIYDTNGVLIFSESVISNTDVTFRKEGLASGIYFYEVVDQKGRKVFSGKVIKY